MKFSSNIPGNFHEILEPHINNYIRRDIFGTNIIHGIQRTHFLTFVSKVHCELNSKMTISPIGTSE